MSQYLRSELYTEEEFAILCNFLSSQFGRKNRTEKNYAYDINMFKKYIIEHVGSEKDITILEVHKDNCKAFIENTDKVYPKAQAPATVERIYSELYRVYEYLKENKKVSQNPFSCFAKPAVSRVLNASDVLSFEDADALLTAADELEIRDKAILLLLFTTGLKIKDFIALNWNNIIYDKNNDLGIQFFKHHREYTNKLHKGVADALLAYRLSQDKSNEISKNEANPIFVNLKGERISQNWVRQVIKEACMIAGIEPLSPSDLRNSIGSFMLAFGASPEEVAAVMGYSDVFLTTRLPLVLPKRLDYIHFNIKGTPTQL